MRKKDIVVVVPVYCSCLSEDEYMALEQCVSILSEYSIVIIKPEDLDVAHIIYRYPLIKVVDFPKQCFTSLRAYNKLVLDKNFYLRFQEYQYMLIYQLDAYVFKDELLLWANKGYDYIGAPWLPLQRSKLKCWGRIKIRLKYAIYTIFDDDRRKIDMYYNYQVGNGGFSLRKINKMIEITHFYKEKIDSYLDDNKPFYPEDLFLLLELDSRKCRLRKPGFKEALKFSIEENPAWGYHYNHGVLPFGCHDWNHADYSAFWTPIIKS